MIRDSGCLLWTVSTVDMTELLRRCKQGDCKWTCVPVHTASAWLVWVLPNPGQLVGGLLTYAEVAENQKASSSWASFPFFLPAWTCYPLTHALKEEYWRLFTMEARLLWYHTMMISILLSLFLSAKEGSPVCKQFCDSQLTKTALPSFTTKWGGVLKITGHSPELARPSG